MDAEADAPIRVLLRMEHVQEVNNEIRLYKNTGDARFLWRAFLLMRKAGDSIPESLMLKFEEWGRKLIAEDNPRKIASALELAGGQKRHIGLKQGATYRARWMLAGEVANVKSFYNITLTEAIDVVARNNKVSVAMVKKIYHQVVSSKKPAKAPSSSPDLYAVLCDWGKK